MHTTKLRLAIGVGLTLSLLVACADGCGCPSVPPASGGRLVITTPINGTSVTRADDETPLTPGIGVTVEVVGQNVPDGTLVTLVNSELGGGDIPAKALTDGRAVFTDVPLLEGAPPSGLINTLRARAGGYDQDHIDLTVVGPGAPACAFVVPAQDALLTEDADPELEHFQTEVALRCSGDTVSLDAAVELVVNGRAPRSGVMSAGEVAFAGVTLAEGGNTLLAYTFDDEAARVGDATLEVEVDTGRCDVDITAPIAAVLDATTPDLDPNTPTLLDLELSVASQRCPEGDVSVDVNGTRLSTGVLSAGVAALVVALPQGVDEVVARVDDGAGGFAAGASLPRSYQVDTLAPLITVSQPASGALLHLADDEQSPPDPSDGLAYTVTGQIADPAGVTLSVAVLLGGGSVPGSPFDVAVSPTGGDFSLPLSGLMNGDYQLRLIAVDALGNSDQAQVRFSVNLDLPAVTLTIVSDTDADDTLRGAEDASADSGYQLELLVEIDDVPDPETSTAVVSAQPVDAAGVPSGAAVVSEAAFDSGGQATLTPTLPEGRYDLTALARSGAGLDGPSTPERLVLIDATPPALVLHSPAQDQVQTAATVIVEAESTPGDFDPVSVVLAVNGVATGLSPAVSDGTLHFAAVPLSGAADGVYTITLTVQDAAGNPAVVTTRVLVDQAPPTLVISGWASQSASVRQRDLSAAIGAPTLLHSGIEPSLDYDSINAGLQYGFKLTVSDERAETMVGVDQASLTVQGHATPFTAPLVAVGGHWEAVFDNGGAGILLSDGARSVSAALNDLVGNAGQDQRFVQVISTSPQVGIDFPADGAEFTDSPITVTASGNLPDGTSCALRLDGLTTQTRAMASGALTYLSVDLGTVGSHTLQVRCTISGINVNSAPHTITFGDPTPPPGPTGLAFLTAASDSAGHLPEHGGFNLGWASTSDTRFHRDVEVQADIASGACAHLEDPALQVTPTLPAGSAVDYVAVGAPGGAWSLVSGDCRATFEDVDLGALDDPGQTSTLRLTVDNAEGGTSTFQVSVMVDQESQRGTLYDSVDRVMSDEGVAYIPYDTAVGWGAGFDTSADPGAQVEVELQVDGPPDTYTARLCSDHADHAGGALCALSGGVQGHAVVERTFTTAIDPAITALTAVPLAQGAHALYVDLRDDAYNRVTTVPVSVEVDTYAPEILSIVALDHAANDTRCAPEDCLSAAENPADFVIMVRQNAADAYGLDGLPVSLRAAIDGAPPIELGGASLAASTPALHFTVELQLDLDGLNGAHVLFAALTDHPGDWSDGGNPGIEIDATNPDLFPVLLVDTVAPTIEHISPVAGAVHGASPEPVLVVISDGANDPHGHEVELRNNNGGQAWSRVESVVINEASFSGLAFDDPGVNAMTAIARDVVGNADQVDFSYDLDSSAPVVTMVSPSPTQLHIWGDDEADDNPLVTSGYWDSSQLSAALTGVNHSGAGDTEIYLEYGAWNADPDSVVYVARVHNSTRGVTVDWPAAAPLNFYNAGDGYPGLPAGDLAVRAVVLEHPTGNQARSAPVHIQVILAEPTIRIFRVDTPLVPLSVDRRYLAGGDQVPGTPAYDTELTVSCLGGGAADITVTVEDDGGNSQTFNATATAGEATLDVDLYHTPAVNTVTAVCVTEVGAYTLSEVVTDVLADDHAPSFAAWTAQAKYLADHDADGNGANGLDLAAGEGVTFSFTDNAAYDPPEDTQAVTMACAYESAGGAPFAVGEALVQDGELTDLPGLVTLAGDRYSCTLSVSDLAGNLATSTPFDLQVDLLRPAAPELIACLGEDTGPASYERDDNAGAVAYCYDAAAHSGACGDSTSGIDRARCDRRATALTLAWVAPGDDGAGGAEVARYLVRYKDKEIESLPSCSASDLVGATELVLSDAGQIVTPGISQRFTLSELGVHRDYCFEVVAEDTAGNQRASQRLLRRVPLRRHLARTGTSTGAFGGALALNGDFDGDGRADLVIGDPGTDGEDGSVLVLYSSGSETLIHAPADPNTPDTSFGGALSVSDYDGDGLADLAIGAPGAADGDGAVYLYFGVSGGVALAGVPDASIAGAPAAALGRALLDQPLNFNADASAGVPLSDLAVGGAGAVWMFAGRARSAWLNSGDALTGADADLVFSPLDGRTLALSAGDFDDDTYGDLVVPYHDPNDVNPGGVFVVFGRDAWPGALATDGAGVVEVSSGVSAFGYSAFAYQGSADAAADLTVLDRSDPTSVVHLYLGTEDNQVAPAGGDTNFIARDFADGFGVGLATMGSVDGDAGGIADLCVSSAAAGVIEFFSGTAAAGIVTAPYTAYQGSAGDGGALAGGGDFNGDGYLDLAVSNPGGAGAVYILY